MSVQRAFDKGYTYLCLCVSIHKSFPGFACSRPRVIQKAARLVGTTTELH